MFYQLLYNALNGVIFIKHKHVIVNPDGSTSSYDETYEPTFDLKSIYREQSSFNTSITVPGSVNFPFTNTDKCLSCTHNASNGCCKVINKVISDHLEPLDYYLDITQTPPTLVAKKDIIIEFYDKDDESIFQFDPSYMSVVINTTDDPIVGVRIKVMNGETIDTSFNSKKILLNTTAGVCPVMNTTTNGVAEVDLDVTGLSGQRFTLSSQGAFIGNDTTYLPTKNKTIYFTLIKT